MRCTGCWHCRAEGAARTSGTSRSPRPGSGYGSWSTTGSPTVSTRLRPTTLIWRSRAGRTSSPRAPTSRLATLSSRNCRARRRWCCTSSSAPRSSRATCSCRLWSRWSPSARAQKSSLTACATSRSCTSSTASSPSTSSPSARQSCRGSRSCRGTSGRWRRGTRGSASGTASRAALRAPSTSGPTSSPSRSSTATSTRCRRLRNVRHAESESTG
mmetsp:Transcript_15602/g.36794  ORF Transcript_15602/g.36794 Transcript_15602/m.36794 type:complete len:214 (+) Transcript_15602:2109-2750(+)